MATSAWGKSPDGVEAHFMTMEYQGELYGKISGEYVQLTETTQDIEKLRRDKERLDWLASVDNKIGNVTLPDAIVHSNISSLRDAIDKAMMLDDREQR